MVNLLVDKENQQLPSSKDNPALFSILHDDDEEKAKRSYFCNCRVESRVTIIMKSYVQRL